MFGPNLTNGFFFETKPPILIDVSSTIPDITKISGNFDSCIETDDFTSGINIIGILLSILFM